MEIFVTKHIGFCSGVKRCIMLTETELRSGVKVYSLGELLHNEQEMLRLKNLGLECIADINQLVVTDSKSCLVIRTHGVEKEVYEKIKSFKNLKVIDGTCPIVKKNQKLVEEWSKKGYNILIFGNKSHPEIKALVSYIDEKVNYNVIETLDVANSLDRIDKNTIVISQTTKPIDEYQQIIKVLKAKSNKIKIFSTICKETILREKEVYNLAKNVEVMVVVGDKHSANTNKLALIAKKVNNNVIMVSSENEIVFEDFAKYNKIGICSGASTPIWLVESIINKLQSYEKN